MSISTYTPEQRRQIDYDRQSDFELFQRHTDELTDATERIALPMRNEFEYSLEDNDLYFGGENIRHILDATIERNTQIVQTQPQFMTELIRNYIERDEYDNQRALAQGETDENILVVLSPIPDMVLQGSDLGAYDLARKKSMARIYQRSKTGITATSLSLDLSNTQGLRAVAQLFGGDIEESATSEDILQMRLWGYSSAIGGDVVNAVRRTYDRTLSQQYGGEWFAGRQDNTVTDAMVFVRSQSDLFAQHMKEVNAIHYAYRGDEKRKHLRDARYNFAAALTRRLRGDGDATSLADAGGMARDNGEQYSGDCPEAMTASQAMSEMAIGKREMTCPFCGLTTYGDPCAARLVCGKCAAEVNNGTLVSRGIGRKNALALLNTSSSSSRDIALREKKPQNRREEVKAQYGNDVEVRYEITLGGAQFIAYDTKTNEALGTV